MSSTDGVGKWCWRRESVITSPQGWSRSGVVVDTWYGINTVNNVTPRIYPFRKIYINLAGAISGGELSKLTQFKNASMLTILFDGFRYWSGDTKNISFRHNNDRTANFLYADGHCESLNISVLPTLTAAQINKAANGVDALKPCPVPHWRIDQR